MPRSWMVLKKWYVLQSTKLVLPSIIQWPHSFQLLEYGAGVNYNLRPGHGKYKFSEWQAS